MSSTGTYDFFFILGRERSGTTYLQSLLNGHNHISIPPESPFIKYLSDQYINEKDWSESTLNGFINVLYEEPYFQRWKLNRDQLTSSLRKVEEPSFAGLCKEIIAEYGRQNDKSNVQLVGDKNPIYSTYSLWLSRAFFPTKFVCITRDYHAQIHSMRKMKLESSNVASLAYRWKYITHELDAFVKFFPEIAIFCTYEELRHDTENALRRICEFLEISYDSEMIERRNGLIEKQAYHKQHHSSLKKDLHNIPDDEWKNSLSPREIRIIEWICHDTGKEFGYEKTQPSLSILGKISAFPGYVYGFLYFPFLGFLDSLPYQLKRFIYQRIFMRFFSFWRKTRKEEQINLKSQSDEK